MKFALLWLFTERMVVIVRRRFGTTHQPHLYGSRNPRRRAVIFWYAVYTEEGMGEGVIGS